MADSYPPRDMDEYFAQVDPCLFKTALNFTLPGEDGKMHSLGDYLEASEGKPVILEWVNFNDPYVKKLYDSGAMQRIQMSAIVKGLGATWVTICSSAPNQPGYLTPIQAQKTLKNYESFAQNYLLDETGKVGKMYQMLKTPQFVVILWGKIAYHGGPGRGGRFILDAINAYTQSKWPDVALTSPDEGSYIEYRKNQP